MYKSHEELKGMKSQSANLGKTLREKTRELEDEQRKNQLLERDVERFKNRQKYMSRIGYLKKKKLWVVSEREREKAGDSCLLAFYLCVVCQGMLVFLNLANKYTPLKNTCCRSMKKPGRGGAGRKMLEREPP
jgi:ribosomal protein S30